MGLSLCIDAVQLRRALDEIEEAEDSGLRFCLAVFEITSAGSRLDEVRAEYSDLFERAHPTDGRLDWGRFQGIRKRYRFVKGKLIKRKRPT